MPRTDRPPKIIGVLSKAHRLRLLTEICERRVASSSELVVACGILAPQAFRALDELEKHGLAERERKEPEGGRPYVFWYPTEFGRKTLEWLKRCPSAPTRTA